MFRKSGATLAALAKLKPVLAVSVASQNSVRRMIGFRPNFVVNANAINSVLEKTKGEGLAGAAASVARASLYLGSHNPSATIEEIDKILSSITDEALKRMAIGVRLRARSELLDVKEDALTVSGGASETEVADIRMKLKEDYQLLKSSSPGCWLVELAAAEYSLYLGEADAAYSSFVAIEEKIKSFLSAPLDLPDAVATPENTNPFSLLGFQLQRNLNHRLAMTTSKCNSTISEAIDSVGDDERLKKALADVKKLLGTQVTDEEAIEITYTLQSANIRHHFNDYFPSIPSEYDDWDSPMSQVAKKNIYLASQPTSFVPGETMEKVRKSSPLKPFFDSDAALRDVLKSAPKDKSVIAAIRDRFGPGPQTALSTADEAFFEALKGLESAGASQDTAGTTAYAKKQKEVARVLARQILYRTQVQIGVALLELNRARDAVEILTPVVNANEYIYMWRALLARSRAYKGLGLITQSDKDVKVLKQLKKSLTEHAPHELV